MLQGSKSRADSWGAERRGLGPCRELLKRREAGGHEIGHLLVNYHGLVCGKPPAQTRSEPPVGINSAGETSAKGPDMISG